MTCRSPSFRVRIVAEGSTTVTGTSRRFGVLFLFVALGGSGLLQLPFSAGFVEGFVILIALLALGAAYGYRVRVSPSGIVTRGTWLGIPLPGTHTTAALDAVVGEDVDELDGGGMVSVVVGEASLYVPQRDSAALQAALRDAIEAATAVSVAARCGQPYRSRPARSAPPHP